MAPLVAAVNFGGLIFIAVGIGVLLLRSRLGAAATKSYHSVGVDLGRRGEKFGRIWFSLFGLAFVTAGVLVFVGVLNR